MPRISKELDSFLKSLEQFKRSERSNNSPELPRYDDSLLIFRRQPGGKLRISTDDYHIIGGRGPQFIPCENATLTEALKLTVTAQRQLTRLLDRSQSFIILPVGSFTAIIFCGLISSTHLGIVGISKYNAGVTAAIANDDHKFLLADSVIMPTARSLSVSPRDIEGFIGYFNRFSSHLQGVLGMDIRAGHGINNIIKSIGELVGCQTEFDSSCDALATTSDAAVLTALSAGLLCHIRQHSSSRCATVSHFSLDGQTVITFEFDPISADTDRCIEYCRRLSERYSIPFAYDGSGASFIPAKLEPSTGELKDVNVTDLNTLPFSVMRRSRHAPRK